MMALVATVVPWINRPIWRGEIPVRVKTLSRPLKKPSAKFFGVEGTFVLVIRPLVVSRATTSVKVPPMSIPTNEFMKKLLNPYCGLILSLRRDLYRRSR
jgi:hypothetical protein